MNATAGVPDLSGLTWESFLVDNLLPVTIGNVIGGAVMVGVVYWFVLPPASPDRLHVARASDGGRAVRRR